MKSTPCDRARAPVTPGRRRVATVIGVLTLLVVISPFTAVCFGGDGHVAVEALPMVHHFMSESGASGGQRVPSAVATSRNGHGPCVDVFLEPVYAPDSQVGGGPAEWVNAAADQAAPAGHVRPAACRRLDSADHPLQGSPDRLVARPFPPQHPPAHLSRSASSRQS